MGTQATDTDTSDSGRAENETVVPQQKPRRYGLYVVGFIGQCKLLWLNTGAVRNVLSYEFNKRLPEA